MSRQSRDKVIEELTAMGVEFDARESYENLCDLLRIETRNRKPAPAMEPAEPQPENLQPLSDDERVRFKELEGMANMGRKIDQPTPGEMLELGRLRARAGM